MTRALTLFALLLVSFPAPAEVPIPAPPKIPSTGYLLMDRASGWVIAEQAADKTMEPASLTKLMTAYVIFRALAEGRIDLKDPVLVSEKAWRTPGSRMFIEVDTNVSVEALLKGMIIQSGNDASVALAEHLAGSEDAFASLMNNHAKQLGLTDSRFQNSTGLPAEDHFTTPRNVALLATALIDEFPEYYAWYSERDYTYNGITQHNRNSLLWRDASVDGLKTGHTDAAGYCLVSSAERDGMRLVAVVMGTPSAKARTDASQALLNYGYRFFETHKLYAAGDPITTARVWKSELEDVPLALQKDLYITIPRGSYDDLSAVMDLQTRLVAPLNASTPVGAVTVSLNGETVSEAPLVALQPVEVGGLWQRMRDQVLLWLE
jgi:D-alanyl-D-alanine carboxypeptidase (penicillin-binding protein 5/6)